MLFLIRTTETYHFIYQLEADTPEEAARKIASPEGLRYVRPDVKIEPVIVSIDNIEAVIVPKQEAA